MRNLRDTIMQIKEYFGKEKHEFKQMHNKAKA